MAAAVLKLLNRSLLAALGLGIGGVNSAQSDLLALLAGEYNNNEQVWQQELDGAAPMQRRHWKFAPAGDDGLHLAVAVGQSTGEPAWLFALADGGPPFERQAASEQAVVQPFSPPGPAVLHTNVFSTGGDAGSSAKGGKAACRYAWRAQQDGFTGRAQPPGACPGPLPEAWRITATHLSSVHEGSGTAYQARRVHCYQGWIALQRRRIDPDAAEEDFIFLKDLRVHDEGFIAPITDGGRPTGYAVELARLTYQRTGVAILKLGVIDQATGKTLSYSWANPLAHNIGINLRWMQSGWTKMED